MNVLFIYNNEDHARPILRAKECFGQSGLTLATAHHDEGNFLKHVLGRSSDIAEVILLQEPPVDEKLFDYGKPVILLERIDGAQLRACREYLPRVAGVIKNYVFRDRARNNMVYDRSHIEILHQAGIECKNPRHQDKAPQQINADEDLLKIHASYGFGAYDRMEPLVNSVVDLDADRPLDVSLHCHMTYDGSEIEAHRKVAIEAVKTWAPMRAAWGAGRTLPHDEYLLSLLRSKVALCPWGWGESTHRDYQAMLLGAVVVKPDTSHVECWPDIYQAGKTYVPCKPDWSDAHDKVLHVSLHWESYREMRETARRLIVEAYRPEVIAQRIAGIIKRIME